MMEVADYQAGERILIRSEPRTVRVARMLGRHAAVEWPWLEVDPESRFHWDGTVAIPTDPTRLDWWETPWRLEPHTALKRGNECLLFIPPTELIVRAVHTFKQPKDLGWLPRPMSAIEVAFAEVEAPPFVIYFPNAEPIELTRLAAA